MNNMATFDRPLSSSSSTRVTLFVAVNREFKESVSVLRWALGNLERLGGTEICVLHVHRPDKRAYTGLMWLPLDGANEDFVTTHRAIERRNLSDNLDLYLEFCRQSKVTARKKHVEMDSVKEGIVKLLIDNEVGILVMGATSVRRMLELRPEKSNYVNKHAPGHTQIWFICKKNVIYTRNATVQPGNFISAPLEDNPGFAVSPREIISQSSSVPRSSFGDQMGYEPEIHWGRIPSAPPHFNPSNYDGWNTVDTWATEAEGYNYMVELDNMKIEKDKISSELEAVRCKKWALESEIKRYELKVKELEQKLELTTHLGESYKKDRDDMQRERDNAIRQVGEARNQRNEGASSLDMLCSVFTSLELEQATNNFDPSLKFREDAYGIIYKGVFHLTRVVVKIPHPNSSLPSLQFRQEAEILCKLRHPNIVNLIGIGTELHALVYEHCIKGTLEDQLNNINQDSSFSWRIRLRIASDLCNVLAFLHSYAPIPIIHGDLRPENIHLDSNYTCKLDGFMISSNYEAGNYPYIDPEFIAGGNLNEKSNVYSFGVILLRMLTGIHAVMLARRVQIAVESNKLSDLLDTSAGWPLEQAKQLAELALRCCEMTQTRRPDLEEDVWKVLESMAT